MKKLAAAALSLILVLALMAGCAQSGTPSSQTPSTAPSGSSEPAPAPVELKKIKVGASPAPHAEILEQVQPILKEQGYDLEIVIFSDYILPNTGLEEGSLDANYFQHVPYLEKFNLENKTHLANAGVIHYEPFGLYGGKLKSLDELKEGSTIAVPNDPTNEARALLLLEAQGIIKLKPDAGLNATALDIAENPKKVKIQELEAVQIPRALADVDFAVINGNYAIEAGLDVSKDALAKEEKDSLAAGIYGNLLAVRIGDEGREEIVALLNALQSDAVKTFIENTYAGAVVPKF